MNSETFIGMMNNAALLLALAVLYDALPIPKGNRGWVRQLLAGFIVGLIGMAVMLSPWKLYEGIIFDTRSILLSISSFFFGPLPALIAVLITGTLRILQGGAGAGMGILVILTSSGLGLGWRFVWRKSQRQPRWYEFYGFGLIVHLTMLLCALALPTDARLDVLRQIWIPVMVIYPVGTVLLGLLLARHEERKQLQQELQQERSLLARITETSLDAIFLTDADGRIFSANPAACHMFGYSEEEICRLERNTMIDKTDPRLPQALAERARSGRFYGELCFVRKNGQKFIGEVASVLFRDLQGQERASLFIRDITDRKQAEEALRESEDKFRYIFDHSVTGKSITQISGEMQINQSFCDMLGYLPEELQNRKWQEITHPEDVELSHREIQRLLSGETDAVRFVKRYLHKDGSSVWADAAITLRRDAQGNPLYFLTSVLNITARVQAEENLKRRTHEADMLRQAASSLTSSLDLNHVLEDLLRQLAQVVPYDSATVFFLEGKQLRAMAAQGLTRPENVVGLEFPADNELLASVKGTDHPIIIKDVQKDPYFQNWGDLGYVRGWMGVPLNVHGELIGWLTIDSREPNAYDQARADLALAFANQAAIAIQNARLYEHSQREIAERRQTERKIKKLNAELEIRVEERTRELREAQEKLVRQEKLAVLGQLAGSVGHELRNPLGVINNAIYFLNLVNTDADEQTRNYLGIMATEVRNADKIINDLLEFSRTKSLEQEIVNVKAIWLQVIERFAIPKNVTVNTNIPDNLTSIRVDPRHMVQVMGNLAVNACQAMPDGGELTFSAWEEEGKVFLSVQDTGMGISQENMKKLFEPLFTTKSKGIGLGLAVSRKLVEANGGRIEVQSEAGKGSTFTVILPTMEVSSGS